MDTATPDCSIPVEYYFDYICPFCYIGHHRLDHLVRHYQVAVRYRFVEIHPNTPAKGQPLNALGYSSGQWARMNAALEQMAVDDNLAMAPRNFTTNSRRALLLARTVLTYRPEAFAELHHALFRAYFVDQRNIGDEAILRTLAEEHGVSDCVTAAWERRPAIEALLEDVEAARGIGLTGVPTLVVAGRTFAGAVSTQTLESALKSENAALADNR